MNIYNRNILDIQSIDMATSDAQHIEHTCMYHVSKESLIERDAFSTRGDFGVHSQANAYGRD